LPHDGNIVDFFIDAKEFITPYLVTVFNYILIRVLSQVFCNGVIVPLFKKGDRVCAENYRGITLDNAVA